MKDLIQLLKLTLSEKKKLIFALICSLFVAFFMFIFINLIQPIMDHMFQLAPAQSAQKNRLLDFVLKNFTEDELMIYLPVLLLVVIFGKGLFTFFSSYFMKSIGLKIVWKIRNELFDRLIHQSSGFFDRNPTGELMSRLTSDVDRIQEAVSGSTSDFMRELLVLVALLVAIFYKDWHLALAAFVIAPLALGLLMVFSRKLKKRGRLNQIKMAQIFSLLHETITGNKIVKAFTMERFELKKFFDATRSYFRSSLRFALIGSLSSPFMEFVGGLVGAFILIVGTSRIREGYISPGDFGSFVMAIFLMYDPIKRLSRANNSIQQGLAGFERVQEIINSIPQIKDHPQARTLPRVKGKVSFDNVSFSYNQDRPALFNVSFQVEPTEKIALVGMSGSGKTTIINLLSRFYDPSSGNIYIDDFDISGVKIHSLRSQIGLVTQETVLFNDTIKNNIAYGLEKISLEKVEEAAKAAKAHNFIMELPKQYETFIGEGGGLLSSGQRQRLAIARALLKDPPILILDEATSSLDTESESLIQIALNNVMKNRTTIIIAHRLSTIRNADKIMVVDKGRIVEKGTHSQLYRKNGIYKKLYDLQFPIKPEEEK